MGVDVHGQNKLHHEKLIILTTVTKSSKIKENTYWITNERQPGIYYVE